MYSDELQAFARARLKESLMKCTEGQQTLFKRMYAPWAEKVADTRIPATPEQLSIPIDEVVDKMDSNKLDWALKQLENTLIKNAKKLGNNHEQ